AGGGVVTIRRLGGAAVAAILLATATAAAAAPSAARLSLRPLQESPRWRALVLDPRSPYVYPKVAEVQGPAAAVSDPHGLEAEGGGATVIDATGGSAPTLVLDLGINPGGTVEVGLRDGTGAPVHLAYAEARRYLTPVGDNVEGSLGTNDVPDGRWDAFPAVAGTHSSLAVRGGERWITLTLDAPGRVSIDFVRIHVGHLRTAPADYTGHFLSNDDVVNRAWYASAYTAEAATEATSEIMMDGAKRDREAFVGDLTVGALTAIDSVRAGPQVARNTIRVFSCQQSTDGYLPGNSDTTTVCPEDPPDPTTPDTGALRSGEYIAWYVVAAQDYLMRTGDAAYVRKLLPVLRRAAGYLRDNMTGDWYSPSFAAHPGYEYGWQAGGGSGPGTYTNTVVYRAFRTLAGLERRLGDGDAAAKPWDGLADALRPKLLATLDPQTGALRGNAGVTVHPQDANVEAVIAGLLEGDAADRSLAFVRDHLWTPIGPRYADEGTGVYISPYMTSYELIARLQRRDAGGALELIRRLWGHMLASDPGSTTWEKVGLDGLPQPNQANPGGVPTNRPEGEGYVSLAHAWSTGPVTALSEWVLGLRPTEPGYTHWIADPQLGDLRWAQGRIGTPAGPLAARVARGAGDRSLRLTVSGPAGTTGDVVVPLLGHERSIALDGRVVWRAGAPTAGTAAVRDGDGVRFTGCRGRHTFAWVA
ncbi:MAG: alpha-L-rhamnosidase, partial [Solirubrobacteraceae bacterium]|nr:alpha-L-rhamnosidase [Solirubrobacteraceae bacterium]